MSAVEKLSEALSAAQSVLPCKHLLHIFPSFGIGGVPLRMVRIINHFGKRFHHTAIVLDNNLEAAARITDALDVTLVPMRRVNQSVLHSVARGAAVLRRLRPDLLLTYNWGAIEWAVASRLLPRSRHIHFEAGFSQGEADAQIPRRVLFRRWALARCVLVVVPSRYLEELACRVWRLPAAKVVYIPNSVDTARFSTRARDMIPGFCRRPDKLVIGTVAPLRPEKNIGRLLRVFAILGNSLALRLIVAGDGVELPALQRFAADLGITDRVVFTGRVAPESVLGAFDIFALSSDTEQMPNALLEAMAAGRAVAAVDVGDVKNIVCEANREFIVARDDEAAFAAAITRLLRNGRQRDALGKQNRQRVVEKYSQERMFLAYSKILYLGLGH